MCMYGEELVYGKRIDVEDAKERTYTSGLLHCYINLSRHLSSHSRDIQRLTERRGIRVMPDDRRKAGAVGEKRRRICSAD